MSAPEPGQYFFRDRVLPGLKAGDYRLRVSQTVRHDEDPQAELAALDQRIAALDAQLASGELTRAQREALGEERGRLAGARGFVPGQGERVNGAVQDVAAQWFFSVTGARWRLDEGAVFSVHPPERAAAAADQLPMVVLRDRELPWVRRPGGPAPEGVDAAEWERIQDELPFLHLLLLKESEVVRDGEALLHLDAPLSLLPAGALQQLAPPADARADLVAVEAQDLLPLLPTLRELRLLSHVRQVNVEDKALRGDDDDAWFSVTVGNRITREGERYVACLVSLEGWGGLLPSYTDAAFVVGSGGAKGAPPVTARLEIASPLAALPPTSRMFLPVLHHWTFTTSADAQQFRDLADRLSVDMVGAGDPQVRQAGHIPVDWLRQDGGRGPAFYRGPLVAWAEQNYPAEAPAGPFGAAEEAHIPAHPWLEGGADLSLPAAYELGRLLGVSDPEFARAVLEWRRSLDSGQEELMGALALPDVAADYQAALERVSDRLADLGYGDGGAYDLSQLRRRLREYRGLAEARVLLDLMDLAADHHNPPRPTEFTADFPGGPLKPETLESEFEYLVARMGSRASDPGDTGG